MSPLLGLHDGRAYALLYNGILGDKRPGSGNVLITCHAAGCPRCDFRKNIREFDGPLTVYGEQSRLAENTLEHERITSKQTPYEVKARD